MEGIEITQKIIGSIFCVIPHTKIRRKLRQKTLVKLGLTRYLYNRRRYNIGEFSYIGKNTKIENKEETTIGKYCSISHEVRLGLSQHPTETLTTHGFVLREKPEMVRAIDGLLCANKDNVVRLKEKPISIGNDVWIGFRAIVMDGVTIGDGAIVAANAVVTKNVPPYTIVAGVPAKPIRKRFFNYSEGGEFVRAKLLELKWWDYPSEFVRKLPFADVEQCIKILEENKHLKEKEAK